jgi:hypothetical protein
MGGFYDSRTKSILDKQRTSELTVDSHPEFLTLDAPTHDPSKDASPSEPNTLPTQGDRTSKPRITITEFQILDKSKVDALGKFLTVLQTIWFIVQYLGRWAAHQPRTQLEVMILAYATLNILIYILWWEKPLDIQEPIDVSGRAFGDARKKGMYGAWSIVGDAFRSLDHFDTSTNWVLASLYLFGILFGGVHCLAWQFPFPTRQEKMLWRVCAIYCTTCPATVILIMIISDVLASRPGRIRDILERLFLFLIFFSIILYVACRVILLVLTFTCLRAPQPGVYEAISWVSFIPHFG